MLIQSEEFASEKCVDKVGSGDCFMAGLIYASNYNYQPQNIINFAAAAAFRKLHEAGDTTNQCRTNIIRLKIFACLIIQK